MELNAKQVYTTLRKKNVEHLYHANSVRTSCTFLREGYLLARGVVSDRGLPQTGQDSDSKDKRYGVWNDVFLDDVDIHERTRHPNKYGPVLFVFDVELLQEDSLQSVWVTKSNPIDWEDDTKDAEKYFSSIQELKHDYRKGRFAQMLMLRNLSGMLALRPLLQRIILDDPAIERAAIGSVYEYALKHLNESAQVSGLDDIPIEHRLCKEDCECKVAYKELDEEELIKFYKF